MLDLALFLLLSWGSPANHSDDLYFEHLGTGRGLSQSTVMDIVQDTRGFLWMATQDGLNRYDGFEFRVYRQDPGDPNSISDNFAYVLLADPNGELWIGNSHGGVNRYLPDEDRFVAYQHNPKDPNSLSSNVIFALARGLDGHIWIGTNGGGVNRLNPTTGDLTHYRHQPGQNPGLADDHINALLVDAKGGVWIGSDGGLDRLDPVTGLYQSYRYDADTNGLSDNKVLELLEESDGSLWVGTRIGLNHLDPKTGAFEQYFDAEDQTNALSNDNIQELCLDQNGVLWIGAKGGGLCRFDQESKTFTRYPPREGVEGSLAGGHISALLQDRSGLMWVGTVARGLNKFSPEKPFFTHYQPQPNRPGSLSDLIVMRFFEDRAGMIWIGTHEKGIDRFDPKTGTFTNFSHDPADPTSISHNSVWGLSGSKDGSLWVGTYGGGLNRFDPKTGRAVRLRHDPARAESLSSDSILYLLVDHADTLWVATDGGGLNRKDPGRDTFRQYRKGPASISSDRVTFLFEDRELQLWIGGLQGLSRLDRKSDTIIRYDHDPDNPASLSNATIATLFEDSEGNLWIGTAGGGLDLLAAKYRAVGDAVFENINLKDGLPDKTIHAILEDELGYLWLSSNNGISRFDRKARSFKTLGVTEGLRVKEFNFGAGLRATDGRMYFGSVGGLFAFLPRRLQGNTTVPSVALTSFKLFNKESPLSWSEDEPNTLLLSYKDSVFSFEFAAMDFYAPEKNQYAYMMEGFHSDWIDLKNKHDITFTNLDPGRYTLRVKGSNNDGVWNENGVALNVRIIPPIWATWWAYSIYVLLVVLMVWRYLAIHRAKLERERAINEKLRLVDRLKDEFLANTSHELRTPLNGIVGIVESLIDGVAGKLPDEAVTNLSLVLYSGKRLTHLINDILDFSKLKNRSIRLRKRDVDLHALVDVVLTLSRPLVGSDRLVLINHIDPDLPTIKADENRLQQVLHNLIGNAVKFTESGEVAITAAVHGEEVWVSVRDTGIGIHESKFQRIFESFEQAEGATTREFGGAGLGLAISRQLIDLHGGRIWVKSKLGDGSTFIFALPINGIPSTGSVHEDSLSELQSGVDDMVLTPVNTGTVLEPPVPRSLIAPKGRFTILIVDDEFINRQVLKNYLSLESYDVLEASGGTEAVEIIDREHVDLVLLDVMMPRMSGYQVCKQLRERIQVHELPIIFLTAKNQVSDLISGFSIGANDYLTKPVSKNELLTRVKTHLELLDINRNLEKKVMERTSELAKKNDELGLKNQEILRTQSQLIMQEKMASMGILAAGIAHEIRNPLNFVNNFASLSRGLSEEVRESLKPYAQVISKEDYEFLTETIADLIKDTALVEDYGKRADQIVQSMMELVRQDVGGWSETDINDLVCKFTDLAYHGVKGDNKDVTVTLFKDMDPGVGSFEVAPKNLSRVMLCLVRNAVESTMEKREISGPEYEPMVRVKTVDLGDWVEIRVQDNGMGVPEGHRGRIFTPFFTTKPTGQGNIGLGLTISYDIMVQEHGGNLTVQCGGGFTTFTAKLPKTSRTESQKINRPRSAFSQ